MGIIKRNKTWHFVKRVPKRFEAVDPRTSVYVSLHTDSENLARSKAPTIEAGLLEYWEALTLARNSDALEKYEGIRRLAASRGVTYRPHSELAEDLPELVARVKRLTSEFGSADKVPADILAADLGGAERPKIHLSEIMQIFEKLSADHLDGKSPDQIRRWRNQRLNAINNFISVVGDKALDSISREDALDFRAWWWDKIQSEGLVRNSANKNFTHLGAIISTVSDMKRLGIDRVFSGMHFKETDQARRRAFPMSWIEENLLGPNPLPGLNQEATDFLLVMVNTGCRPSEIAGLLSQRIRLEDNIPHIQIRPDGRQLKTAHSLRDMPLVGVSLEAMRRNPEGFPRYLRNAGSWSNLVNKYFRDNKLVPGPGYSAYSLRHSFEDRMLAADLPDRLASDLMGHTTERPKYGDGAALSQKLKALKKIVV